jgi:hypothetical protein
MNEKLIAPYTAEDVKNAVFSIGDLKAPGPNGLHALFYKKVGTWWGILLHRLCCSRLMISLFLKVGMIRLLS